MSTANQSSTVVRTVAIVALACGLIAVGLHLLEPFLIAIVSGGIVALLSRPLYQVIDKHLRIPALSSLLTLLSVAIIVLLPLSLLITALVHESASISTSLHSSSYSLTTIETTLTAILTKIGVPQNYLHPDLGSYVRSALHLVESRSSTVIGGVIGAAISVFLGILTAFYVLQTHETIKEASWKFSPLSIDDTSLIWQRTKEVIYATVTGNLILVSIETVLAILDFTIFKVHAPVLLGSLFGIACLVPTVGSSLVWIPIVAIELLQGNILAGVGVAGWCLLQVLTLDNFLGPHLIQRQARLHPFLVLLGVLGGVGQFGLLGFILGPTIIALAIVGLEILQRFWQNTPGTLLKD